MSIIDLIKIIFDKDKSIGQKALIFSLIFIFIFMFDLSFKFSFDNHYSSKLDNLEKISRLKESYKNEPSVLKKIYNYENTILSTRHYSEFLSDVILNIHLNTNDIIAKQSLAETTEMYIKKKIIWHFIFSVITSSLIPMLILIFMIILLPFGLLLKAEKFMLGWLGAFSISLFTTVLLTLISLLIPIIFGLPIINYIINILIQTGFMHLIIKQINKF